jgi:hypothetical protein
MAGTLPGASAIVIGDGPSALRAAATLRALGRTVTWLREGDGAEWPMPVGIGATEGAVEGLGAMASVAPGRALLHDGRISALPLTPRDAASLLPRDRLPRVAAGWARARGRRELAELVGGGHETRTYAQWVSQRFGAPTLDALYAPYCRARFGEPTEISANVARAVHGRAAGAMSAPAAGWRKWIAGMSEGIAIETRVEVRRIERGAVETGGGRIEGEVFVDAEPRRVCHWMGTAGGDLAAAVAQLRTRERVQVMVRGGGELPFDTHVIGRPYYRLTRPGMLPGNGEWDGMVVAHLAIETPMDDAELVRVVLDGLGRLALGSSEGEVMRVHAGVAAWVHLHARHMRAYVMGMVAAGVVPVGVVGLHSPLDWGAELGWVRAMAAGEPVRDAMRRWVEAPVVVQEGGSLREFAWR